MSDEDNFSELNVAARIVDRRRCMVSRRLYGEKAARVKHFPCMDAAHRRNKGMLTLRSLRELQVPAQAQTNLPANVEAKTL